MKVSKHIRVTLFIYYFYRHCSGIKQIEYQHNTGSILGKVYINHWKEISSYIKNFQHLRQLGRILNLCT